MHEPHDPELFPLEGKLVALERITLGLGGDIPDNKASSTFEKSLAEGLQYYGIAWALLGREPRTPDFLVQYDFAWKSIPFEVVARARILAGDQEIKQVSSRGFSGESLNIAIPPKEAAESLSSRINEALLEYVQKDRPGNSSVSEITPAQPAPPSLAEKSLTAFKWRSILLVLLALIALIWIFRDSWRHHLEHLFPAKMPSQTPYKPPAGKH